jgi:hypothetical protein
MKIDWELTPETKQKAIRISELKEREKFTYEQLAALFGHHRTYIIELKKEGDKLRKEQEEHELEK